MISLSDLNTNSAQTISFTDNRNPSVVLSYPEPKDIIIVLSGNQHTLQRRIDVIDIIKPAETNLKFIVDISNLTGATIDWGTLPSGVSVIENLGVYTVSGITSVEDWNAIKDPDIDIPVDFNGDFFYYCTIQYTNGSELINKQWLVSVYLPFAYLESVANISPAPTQIFQLSKVLNLNFEVIAIPDNYILNSAISVDISVDRYPVYLTPVIGAITYELNSNFSLINFPTIWGPVIDDMELQIIPSDSAAIQEYNVSDVIYNYNNTFTYQGTPGSLYYEPKVAIGGDTAFITWNSYIYKYDLTDNSVTYTGLRSETGGEKNFVASDSYIAFQQYGSALDNVYVYDINTLTLQYTFTDPISDGVEFGQHIALTDNYIIIARSTRAYVYDLSDGSLVQSYSGLGIESVAINDTYYSIDGEVFELSTGNLHFDAIYRGTDSAMDENYLLLGNSNDAGAIRLINLSDGSTVWTVSNPLPAQQSDFNFGAEVDLTEDHAIVSDRSNSRVYVYKKVNGELLETISSQTSVDGYGENIVATRDYLIIGPGSSTSQQPVEFYTRPKFSVDANKVLTINDKTDNINSCLADIFVIPAAGYNSNYTLTYKGIRPSGDFMTRTQNVNYN